MNLATSASVAIRRNPPLPQSNRLPCMADVVRIDTFLMTDNKDMHDIATIKNTLGYQYQMKVPFVFSPSANADEWEKYGFCSVCDKEVFTLNENVISEAMLEKAIAGERIRISASEEVLSVVKAEELMTLACFANSIICRQYGVFVIRSAIYYEKLQKKVRGLGGEIFLIKENQKIKGCFVWLGKKHTIEEAIFEKAQDTEKYFHSVSAKKTTAMARIVNLEEMLKHISSNGKVTIAIRITDTVILENNGLFIWYLDEKGSSLERVAEERNNLGLKPELTVSIGELTAFLFSYKKLKPSLKFDSIYLSGPVWINEIEE